ncbi:MAG: winged helix-turn-helix transcriptional regulator [Anaerolineales bacterium]|jgi:ArsR family transcriptional regulator|nr:winged helix-turn-helix transcriptional regulator [Anaerolineales bacterium]MCK5314881.1 winged helix-turn-helix transcriptional regulator [Anaerolineales bacterium]MCK5431050.1 winged helix-turn-helix transcriptional regulator [Anaerolineales bacterium]
MSNTVNSVEFAKALADDTRQEIMRLCCCEWLNVGEIVDAISVSQPTVSHHLSILRAAGLVNVRREGKQVFYTLNQQRIAAGCCVLAENYAPEQEIIRVPKSR